MRLTPRGQITPCNYDFQTQLIGYVRVTLPMVFAEEYTPAASLWTRHDLWKELLSDDENVAAMIVNNVFLVSVTRTAITVKSKDVLRRPQIAAADTQLLFNPTVPIGFVRTKPEVLDVNVPPYILYMDATKRVSIYLGEFITVEDPVEGIDMSLYKALIASNRVAIYKSAAGPKFL